MDKRLLFTMLVCVGITIVWQTFVAPPPKKPKATVTATSQPTKADATTAQAVKPAEVMAASQAAVVAENKVSFATEDYTAVVSNHGAALVGFTLKNYREGSNKRSEEKHPVDLVPTDVSGVQFLVDGSPLLFETISKQGDGVALQGQRGGVQAQATWKADATSYLLDYAVTLKNEGTQPVVLTPEVKLSGLFDEKAVKDKGMFEPPPDLVTPAAYADEKLFKHENQKQDDPKEVKSVRWAGIDRQYFLIAAAPVAPLPQAVKFREQRDLPNSPQVPISSVLVPAPTTLAPGQSVSFNYKVFAGPKQAKYLKAPGLGFDESVDYNVWYMPLGFLARPMLWVLNRGYDLFHSYGLAIIFLTFIVKLLMFPVTQKSFESMQVMKDLKPELDKIKERFPNDREKQGMETMRLYKEKKVNPFLSGCLPALLQMPVYFALWRTLWSAVELYQQQFLWLGNLTAKDPYYIMPLLFGGTMFLQQKVSPPVGDPQQQKIMMYMMPPMMTLFMVGLPSGLVIYIFANTCLTILQQLYITKKFARRTAARQTA